MGHLEAMSELEGEVSQISCEREWLVAGIGIVQRGVSSRSTLPILSGTLLETTDNGLRLVGTDLELSIETYIPAMFTGQAAMVLPARYLGDIARRLPEKEVSIAFNPVKRTATVSSGRAVYCINSMDPAEFPLFPQVGGDVWWKVEGTALAQFVRQTAFAAATDENRPFLTGVLMAFDGREVRFAATDTFRLALRRVALGSEAGPSAPRQLIVPARAFVEVGKIVQTGEDEVEVYTSENQVAFKCQKTTIVSRVIDGQFPNYERVIPKNWRTRIVVDKARLLDAVERAAVMGKDEFGTVRLELGGETRAMMISANAPEVGNAQEEIAVSSSEGERSEVALRSRYLVDVLRVVDDEEISMETTGPVSPVVFRRPGENSRDYLYLIMPVTVNA
ncbi:MAG: DNA polymerase III subunit beta [Bacillota bacterium]